MVDPAYIHFDGQANHPCSNMDGALRIIGAGMELTTLLQDPVANRASLLWFDDEIQYINVEIAHLAIEATPAQPTEQGDTEPVIFFNSPAWLDLHDVYITGAPIGQSAHSTHFSRPA